LIKEFLDELINVIPLMPTPKTAEVVAVAIPSTLSTTDFIKLLIC
jgi:hypothetical protein